jgi:hypothetical protein
MRDQINIKLDELLERPMAQEISFIAIFGRPVH